MSDKFSRSFDILTASWKFSITVTKAVKDPGNKKANPDKEIFA